MKPCVPSAETGTVLAAVKHASGAAPLRAAMLDRGCARSRRQSAVGTKKRPSVEQRNNARNARDFAELDAHY